VILPKSLTTVTSLSKILAAILFVALPLLSFYLGMEYEKALTQDFVESPTQIVRMIPKPITDPTEKWKTYTNGSTSFKYPQLLKKDPSAAGFSSLLQSFTSEDGVYRLIFLSFANFNEQTGKPYWSSLGDLIMQNSDHEVQYTMLDNQQAIKILPYTSNIGTLNEMVSSSIRTLTKTLSIEIKSTDQAKVRIGSQIFDQILSSFKFIDQKQAEVKETDITKCEADIDCIIVPYSSCCGATKKAINKMYLDEYNSHKEWQSFWDEKACAVMGICADDSNVIDILCVVKQCQLKYSSI